jgi:cation-transporting ATPase 13A3/4/5
MVACGELHTDVHFLLLLWGFYCLHLSDTCISMENIKCRYGIILSQMDYIFIDGVAVLILGYAMTLCYPEDKLGKV